MVRILVCAAVLAFPTIVFGQPRVATPTFSVGGGDYTTVVMVVVLAKTPGATIRFTQNGSDPTESDPVIVSGSRIAINTSLTLKARAWKTGLRPSEVRAATYRMVSLKAGPPIGGGDAAAGGQQSVLAAPDGRVFTWNRDATPVLIDELSGVTDVAAGPRHALAVTKDGQVYAWGVNRSGQLGGNAQAKRLRPFHVAGLTNVVRVAAGRTHSLALTGDGRVFAFGANTRGQLGIGSSTRAHVPTLIPSLLDVVAIDAGDAHSVAITRTGQLFAWGANERGQLGDGSREDRQDPVLIALDTLSAVAAGGDHTLALGRDGAVYSWGSGARGQLGTGSTAWSVRPARVSGLHAFAVAAGRNFSAAVRDDGALVTWGANDAGQLGDGTRLDRATPGVGPTFTNISTLALGNRHAIAVTASGDVWTWGRQAAPIEAVSDIADWGPRFAPEELQPPTIHPPSAAYPGPQTVTLAGAGSGHTLRYTVDGSDPTLDSTLYSAPFVVSVNTTVKARAFSSATSVQPSATVSHDYAIDMSPPSIVAEASPPLTSAWMTTPVTVSFRCADDAGAVSCPPPVTIGEGAAQLIRGTAVDAAGNQTTASLEVSVDLTPPFVVFDALPGSGVTEQAQITLRGRVFDAASGLAGSVRCNGDARPVAQESFECSVDLKPGVNSVTVQAHDVAGHVAAGGIEVTRVGAASTLAIAPDFRAMVANQVVAMSVRDNFGAIVSQAVWSSSDSSVVELSTDDPPWVKALSPGTVTITAQKGGLAAEATIAVHAGLELPPGTTRWTVGQTPGYAMGNAIYTSRVDAGVPEIFIVESLASGEALLRAATSEGEVMWQQHSPGVPLMGDVFGGVIAGVPYDVGWLTAYRAYVRLGTAGGVRPWRYDSANSLLSPAQAPDGTVYAIEQVIATDSTGEDIWDKHIIALDGKTGRLLQRFPLPRETHMFTAASDGTVISTSPFIVCRSTRGEAVPRTAGPVIGSDGKAYFLLRRQIYQAWASCLEHGGPPPAKDIDRGIDLIVLAANAAPVIRPLYSERCQTAANIRQVTVCDGPFSPDGLMPDGIGGLLATWTRTAEVVAFNPVRAESVLTRWDTESVRTDRAGLDAFLPDFVGQAGITYRGAHSAFNVVTGERTWSRQYNHLISMAATPEGGVAMLDYNARQLHHTDATGAIVFSQPFGLGPSAVHEFGQWIGPKDGTLTSIAGTLSDATRWRTGGNFQGQFQLRRPGVGIFAKSHEVQAPFNFQHASIRVTPTFQQFWRELKPADFVNVDEYGNFFMTIGAGTADGDTSASCSGTLTKGINRERDVDAIPLHLEKLPLPALDEIRVINDLYVSFGGYSDDLPYACLPELNPGKYNSNSFASGILRRVGAPLPLFPLRGATLPGWATPVPPHKFVPQ